VNKKDLTRDQRVEALERRDADREEFDIWLLNYLDTVDENSKMNYQDYVFEYYIEMCRIDKIDNLLDDEDSMCKD